MKAVVYRGAGSFGVEDVPSPTVPEDGLVLRVEACGICGSDLRTVTSGARLDVESQILGHEIAGVVESVGSGVSDYAPGDRLSVAADVHCHRCYYCRRALYNLCEDWKLIGLDYPGGMAERMVLPGDILRRGIVHRMPDGMSFEAGSLAEPASSVLSAFERLQVGPSEVVVIIGNGPIGCLAVQVARARGAKPILVGRRSERLALAEGLGAWKRINARECDLVSTVRDLTEGRGADAVLTACKAKEAQVQAVELVRKRGRVGIFGGLPKDDHHTSLDLNRIHYDEIDVLGTFSYHPRQHAIALDLISRGVIEAHKIITSAYPISRAGEAFEAAQNGNELKVIIKPNDAA